MGYIFLTSIFLLNTLIAVLTVEYNKVESGSRWRYEKAMLIMELQSIRYLALFCYGSTPAFASRFDLVDDNTLGEMRFSDVPLRKRWMHVMPPDGDSFWNTNLEPERSEVEICRLL